MSKFFADIRLKRNGGLDVKADALEGKIVALYFSAHWCPPCRAFTPVLKKFYEEAVASGVEIVFISLDYTAKDMEAYLKESHGNWLYVPFDEKKKVGGKHPVTSIPTLILIKPDGTAVNKEADDDVQNMCVNDAVAKWKKQLG